MQIFRDQEELIRHARNFISGRLKSLENDVDRCISKNAPGQPAPFPVLLYCFSIIDLLGSLYFGDAKSGRGISYRSREFMQRFMGYTTEQSRLLQDVFRHKIVHLAQPNPITKVNSQKITWIYYHENPTKHLLLETLSEKKNIDVTSLKTVEYDHIFNISIVDFVSDIKNSVDKPTGYLASLENSVDLQNKYKKAISQIYD